MDRTDGTILKILAEDANISSENISNQLKSKRISLTPRAIRKRINSLEQQGIIKKYVTIFDEKVAGATVKRLVMVKFQNNNNFLQRLEDYKQYIQDSPFCTFALRMTGEFDWIHYKCFPTKELADMEDDLFRTVFGDMINEHRIYDVDVTKITFNQINDERDIKTFIKQVSKDIILS